VGRNKKILILLLVIWVGILAYHSGIFVGTPVMPKRAGPGPTVLSVLEDLPELRLELLDRPRPGYRGIKKNIFSPLKVHVPKPPPKPPKKSPPKPPPVVVKPPPPPPPSPLEVFTSKVKFIGFLEKEKDKTVFLNKGEDVFLVKSGDIIDDRFRVAEITDTVLRFNDEVNGDTATLDLETE
jgi:hypothetical protein